MENGSSTSSLDVAEAFNCLITTDFVAHLLKNFLFCLFMYMLFLDL